MPFLAIEYLFVNDKTLSQINILYHKKLSPDSSNVQKQERAWKIPSSRKLFSSEAFVSRNHSGSLTIEASLGLTVFLLFMTALCQLFLVMQLQLRIQNALEQVGNEAAQYSYLSGQVTLWDSQSQLITEIEEYLLAELSEEALRLRFLDVAGEEYLDHSVLENGTASISFDQSSILREHHRIKLVVSYRIRLPLSALGLGSFSLSQQSYRYAWLGDAAPERKRDENEEQMVYVAKNGQVYHLTLSCTYLNLSVHPVDYSRIAELRNDSGGKYYACERCRPGNTSGTVYITNDGTRYHGDRECSGIRRNVTAIPISQVGDRRLCSRCGQE